MNENRNYAITFRESIPLQIKKKKLCKGGPCHWVTDPDTIPTKNAYQLIAVPFQQQ